MSQMLNLKAKIFVSISFVFITMLLTNPLLASLMPSLYDVDIAVTDESADARQLAFTQGLSEVFIRISGDSFIMNKLKRPPASRYVQQFSYLPIENPVINADGEVLKLLLKIKYNGNKIEKYLLNNGFSVWSEHRSDVVVWLAIRDGQNEYVLKDGDSSLLKTAMNEALNRRGIANRWPLYDYQDQKTLTVADIRGGFKGPLMNASKRYGNGPVLAGSMIWNGQQWQSSWSLLMASNEQYWSLLDSDYTTLINTAVDTAADVMGSVYAINNASANLPLVTLQLDVEAVTSIERYRRVENYLKKLSAVDTALPVSVNGQNAVFLITLRSEEKDFLNLINNDAEIVEVKVIKPSAVPAPELPPGAARDTVSETTGTALSDNTSASAAATVLPDSGETGPALPRYYYRLIN